MRRTASRRSSRRFARIVTALVVAWVGGVGSAAVASGLFEPTVTAAESDLLQRAVAVAKTNGAAAVAILGAADAAEASAAIPFALGNLHFQADRLAAAETAYKAALAKLPKFRAALNNLGRVYLMQEQPESAIEVFQALVRDGQADADMLRLLGHALLLNQQPLSAENAFRQSLLLQPNAREAMQGLAKSLIEQQRFPEALALVKELLAIDADARELWSLRANAELALDRLDDALVSMELAWRLGVAEPQMLATLGDLYLNRRQPDDAVRAYDAAFAGQSPSAGRMLRAAEGLVMGEALPRAEQMLARVERLEGSKPGLVSPEQRRQRLRLRAHLARLQGRVDVAREAYEELVRQDPLDAESLLALGDMATSRGALEEAVMHFERAARIAGQEARALVRQAQVEVERERYRQAVDLLESAQTFVDQPHVSRYLEQVRRLAP